MRQGHTVFLFYLCTSYAHLRCDIARRINFTLLLRYRFPGYISRCVRRFTTCISYLMLGSTIFLTFFTCISLRHLIYCLVGSRCTGRFHCRADTSIRYFSRSQDTSLRISHCLRAFYHLRMPTHFLCLISSWHISFHTTLISSLYTICSADSFLFHLPTCISQMHRAILFHRTHHL